MTAAVSAAAPDFVAAVAVVHICFDLWVLAAQLQLKTVVQRFADCHSKFHSCTAPGPEGMYLRVRSLGSAQGQGRAVRLGIFDLTLPELWLDTRQTNYRSLIRPIHQVAIHVATGSCQQ